MTSLDVPTEPFRLSQLIYDTRYRSLTIQAVAVLLFMLAAAWLVNNTVQNLAALGKDFNFGFLGTRAGYDINQALIPYTNDSTHGRAALVGILNTLLVACFGCLAATVIGVFMGVLRLSRTGSSPGSPRSMSRASATCRCCCGSSRSWRSSPRSRRRRRRFAARTPPPRCCSAIARGDQPRRSTCPGRCSGRAGRSSSRAFLALADGDLAVRPLRPHAVRRRPGEILPTFWIKLALFFVPVAAGRSA